MLIETVQMDPRIAAVHYRDYRHKVRAFREERRAKLIEEAKAAGKELGRIRIERTRMEREDAELMKAYHALTKGQRILNLVNVLRKAGIDAKTRLPNLAIARADWKDCYFQVSNGHAVYSEDRWANWSYNTKTFRPVDKHVAVLREVFPAEVWNTEWRKSNSLPGFPVKAMVPSIPPHLRPKDDLSGYHILWEPRWDYVPPADPFLLRKISDHFYVILAQWDLTSIEQLVLEERIGT